MIAPEENGALQDPCASEPPHDLGSQPSKRRSRESHEAVIRATTDLLREVGYQRLSLEGVARRAGVGKATIYRWWPNKAALVIEALGEQAPLSPVPDTGDLEADLRTAVRLAVDFVSAVPTCLILPALIADLIEDPAGTGSFAEFLHPRRASVVELLERARLDGRLPPDADTTLMVDIYAGTVVYRASVSREPLNDEVVDEIVDLLLHARIPSRRGSGHDSA